ncbi:MULTISPECIES: ParB/RepB/Spo0J family partition protein [Virgibacillus]|uniref:Stage 0 sporulation protein J n=1 Tax=Virgibacillus kapii TaxID=1638645 RepID=A0ABQ2DFL0_9BACI|nr:MULTISPECIES: ParB/RepB/Spo0J family partition protein [Virgibacillus]EQB38628.1 plasmid partitioning protein ParB [Virgibacillus sp. CM-4]MYL41342.1 ParB/RepB/Spo0J family partition protein [Virgibacillus massiliensis]GGJ56357.1 stage 0 sporulation protein J [Virgibacillus kapii]
MAKGLGKGINAFFPEIEEEKDDVVQEIAITECRPNPYQPRKTFHADAIEELKESILEYGIIQPLIVRKSIKGYEIVVGERRYRAGKEAGLEKIPVVIKELSDEKMMELALLENLQREDLTPIEEAHAYANLMNELKITQEELSKRLGKSRSHIANMVRLLSLPEKVIAYINNGELSMGHGRALLGIKDKSKLQPLIQKIRREKLNVRQVEQLILQLNDKQVKKKEKPKKDVFLQERESYLRNRLGTAVSIQRGKRKGKIEIEFYNDDDLQRIMDVLE